jgi:hypothetical protein
VHTTREEPTAFLSARRKRNGASYVLQRDVLTGAEAIDEHCTGRTLARMALERTGVAAGTAQRARMRARRNRRRAELRAGKPRPSAAARDSFGETSRTRRARPRVARSETLVASAGQGSAASLCANVRLRRARAAAQRATMIAAALEALAEARAHHNIVREGTCAGRGLLVRRCSRSDNGGETTLLFESAKFGTRESAR